MIYRLTEEAGARHRAYADLPGQVLTKPKIAVIAKLGDVQKDIVGAFGAIVRDTQIVQALQEQLLLMGVFCRQSLIIVLPELQAGNDCLLQRRCSAHREKIVNFLARSMILAGARM